MLDGRVSAAFLVKGLTFANRRETIPSVSDTGDSGGSAKNVHSLAGAIRRVRTAEAERSDVVVELRDAERVRLEMLADELKGVFAEVPADDEQFVFGIAPGTRSRLWINLTSFVMMGRDRRTYRFLKDTRLGRTVIRETPDLDEIADTVTQYVAERIIERARAIEGDWVVKRITRGDTERRQEAKRAIVAAKEPPTAERPNLSWVAAALILGILLGILGLLAYAWVTVPG